MKTLYLECAMGAAGDMLTAALSELLPDKEGFLQKMNSLGLLGVVCALEPSTKCGVLGTHFSVSVGGKQERSLDEAPDGHRPHRRRHNGAHEHSARSRGMADIGSIIAEMPVSDGVKRDVSAVYEIVAQAESRVHGVPAEQIHFHELGSLDALADITAFCLLMEQLAPERVLCSPVCTGFGTVKCNHGILPVPAPATAEILKTIPIYAGKIEGEMCTPTGAALLRHFVTEFCEMPLMETEKIGCGMGKKDFAAANCVRAFLGETRPEQERITELKCNIDDMTGEAVGFAMERLFDAGALDVYTCAVGMKKCRPGIILCCMCSEKLRDKMLGLIFKHTTTLGVREYDCRRYTLSRREETVETKYGPVRIKLATGWDVYRCKAEYDDLARIARETGEPLMTTQDILKLKEN